MFSYKLSENTELRLLEERHAQQLTDLTNRNREYLRAWLPWVDTNRTVEELTTTHVLQPYCNLDGTVPYAADIESVRRRQKCCKTADLPDMPVRNVTGHAELTRRRSLVRTQHRPLSLRKVRVVADRFGIPLIAVSSPTSSTNSRETLYRFRGNLSLLSLTYWRCLTPSPAYAPNSPPVIAAERTRRSVYRRPSGRARARLCK